ncbi:YopX protein [Cellulophaga phage Nekkels_1]|uniref:YopX protein n=1 Tax=Cellulophaga phage Nekkels_1 TaxID=2745692 RepID=A0A8E4UXG3_9CAUD|nr:YopX protein [Cellulophaga phage Nekkels_1]QQO97029.1 YopX protein [Cellulophaga phage Nekkels_1]QQO97122.1 YopX protein [Cellulophaga phage Nekkels_2]
MRKIEFRGMSKHGWSYGLPHYSPENGVWAMVESNGWTPSYANPDEGECNVYTAIDYNTVGQSTGFKDNKGNKIFDGDIIRLHTGLITVDDQLMKVCFNQGAFGLRSLEHDGVKIFTSFVPMCAISKSLMDRNIFKEAEDVLEVIGNIHQNKELIK